MKLLSIDYGAKYIGLAGYNSMIDVVLPLGRVGGLEEVVNLIKQENIDKVIVGWPLDLAGGGNRNTDRVNKFITDLKKQIPIGVELVDERFSSQQADKMGDGVSRDEKAAMVILQTYLDKNNS